MNRILNRFDDQKRQMCVLKTDYDRIQNHLQDIQVDNENLKRFAERKYTQIKFME